MLPCIGIKVSGRTAPVSIAVDIVSQTITFPAIAAQTYAPGRTVALAAAQEGARAAAAEHGTAADGIGAAGRINLLSLPLLGLLGWSMKNFRYGTMTLDQVYREHHLTDRSNRDGHGAG